MAYQMCRLGSYTYKNNPVNGTQNPLVRSTADIMTQSDVITVDWGFISGDRKISQKWPLMFPSQYNAMLAVFQAGGTTTFYDEDGASWSVIIKSFDFGGFVTQKQLYQDVEIIMRVLV